MCQGFGTPPLIHIWIGYRHRHITKAVDSIQTLLGEGYFRTHGPHDQILHGGASGLRLVQLHPFLLVPSFSLFLPFPMPSSQPSLQPRGDMIPLATLPYDYSQLPTPCGPAARCGQVSKRTRQPSLFFVNTHSLSTIVTFDSRKWRWPPPQATTTSFSLSRSPRKS